LNLYPIASHGNCKFQSWVWPLWRPYFRKPYFIVSTICSTNLSSLGWSYEVMWWSINAFSQNSWNSQWNFVFWLVKTSVRSLKLLNAFSKNAYASYFLLWSRNGTNSNHLEKCSIITKTY
jgi:hypothetical protein